MVNDGLFVHLSREENGEYFFAVYVQQLVFDFVVPVLGVLDGIEREIVAEPDCLIFSYYLAPVLELVFYNNSAAHGSFGIILAA